MGRLIFVVVFFGLTLLPMIQMATGLDPEFPLDENRRAAPAPSLATPFDQIPNVAEKWFGDHFGLRSLLIRTKAQIDFSVFGMSDRVLVGSDGQLFYRNTVNIEPPFMERLLASKRKAAVRGLRALSDALHERGIGLVLIVNMMSDRFYPELLPRSAIRRPSHPLIDDFISEVRAHPNVGFVDSTAILRETKKKRRIFHRTDFHWNDPAAFEVARAVIDSISERDGRAASVWSHNLEIETKNFSGGIATFLPVFVPPSENGLFVKQTWTWPAGLSAQLNKGIFEQVLSFSPDKRLLPRSVLVGDSFLDGMLRSGLEANFCETYRIRWRPGLKISDITANLPSDTRWLIVQFIEVAPPPIDALADEQDIAKAIMILNDGRQNP